MLKNKAFNAFKFSYAVFIMLVGILTFMSMKNSCSIELSMQQVLKTQGLVPLLHLSRDMRFPTI